MRFSSRKTRLAICNVFASRERVGRELEITRGRRHTGDANTIYVVRNDASALNDVVELRAGAVKNDRVETDAVEEAEVDGELLYVVEDGASDLDDCELCGVGRV